MQLRLKVYMVSYEYNPHGFLKNKKRLGTADRCRYRQLGYLFRMEIRLKQVSTRILRPVAFRHLIARDLVLSEKL